MTAESPNQITITGALPYANGEIHLGHIVSTYLPADIFARYCRLRGIKVVYICATDDFGTPILIKAEQEGKSPEEYVNYWHERDLKDFTDLGISFDFFYKTSSKENIELTQFFFRRLFENGYIYRKRIRQLYCRKDNKFLPDRYVVGTCPFCGATRQYSDGCEQCGKAFQPGEILNPSCAICGDNPIEQESEHYFFQLSKFSEQLKKWLVENSNLQREVRNYVLNWIAEGLKDWDITRDIRWGVPIPLPDAEGKVLYGWFDNHICYISSTLKYLENKGLDGKEYWNNSTIYHFIGKDIVYHHYLFLPAMRMGIGGDFKLPDYIPTRGHLLLQGQKFSKSRGWYISLRDFLNAFPADYLRYYLASVTPLTQSDVNFDWNEFMAKINNELVANIGNFIYRTLSFIASRYSLRVPEPEAFDELDRGFEAKMKTVGEEVGTKLFENENERALKEITNFSSYCNQYFQRKEPWTGRAGSSTCLYLSINAVRCLALILAPYLVRSMGTLWRQLNLQGSVHEQIWSSSSVVLIRPGHIINKPEILFRKIEAREIKERLERIGQAV